MRREWSGIEGLLLVRLGPLVYKIVIGMFLVGILQLSACEISATYAKCHTPIARPIVVSAKIISHCKAELHSSKPSELTLGFDPSSYPRIHALRLRLDHLKTNPATRSLSLNSGRNPCSEAIRTIPHCALVVGIHETILHRTWSSGSEPAYRKPRSEYSGSRPCLVNTASLQYLIVIKSASPSYLRSFL